MLILPSTRGILKPAAAGGGGADREDPLSAVISSVVFDLDATLSDSYPGSGQTWSNLIASPADGASQTDYDFFLGADVNASTDDPTFNGTPNDEAAYFSFDGGDYFQIAGGNTTFLNALHKTTGGTAWWLCVAWRTPPDDAGGDGIIGTEDDFSNPGILVIQGSSTERVQLSQYGDTGTDVTFSTSTMTAEANNLFIISWNGSSALRFWVNTISAETVATTFNSTATNAAVPMQLGRAASAMIDNGARFYNVSMGNEYLDDTKAADIIAQLELRHGRDYTP